VVTTNVGGNAEVVCSASLGTIVAFGDGAALGAALDAALRQPWDREAIMAYARENTWDRRVAQLERAFHDIAAAPRAPSERRA
jgi:teichuronic acid biosynthesis glycosyltransferase TuaC